MRCKHRREIRLYVGVPNLVTHRFVNTFCRLDAGPPRALEILIKGARRDMHSSRNGGLLDARAFEY